MKKFNKIMTKFFIASAAVALPAVTLTSCSVQEWFTPWDTSNITSTYYNSYDMLISLGIIPNASTYARSSWYDNKPLNVFPYMDKLVKEGSLDLKQNSTDYTQFGTYSDTTSGPDLQALASVESDTVVINEWARPNEPQYKYSNVTQAVAYTSMADSINAKYTYVDNELGTDWTKATPWNHYREGLFSYRKALLMLAKDLDNRYAVENKKLQGSDVTYKTYEDRANDIINSDKNVINDLKTSFQNSELKDKTIGIIAGQTGSGAWAYTDKVQAIYDPFIYPEIYGPDGIGMGVSFPTLDDEKTSAVKFADNGGSLASIKSADAATLAEAYKGKFDKIIFVRSPGIDEDKLNAQLEKIRTYLKTTPSKLTVNLSDDEKLNDNSSTPNSTTSTYEDKDGKKTTSTNDVVVVNWQDWYPTTWGAYGKTHLFDQIKQSFNMLMSNTTTSKATSLISYDTSKSWKTYKPSELVKPHKFAATNGEIQI